MPEPIISSLIPTTGSNSGSLEKFIQISNGCFARTFGDSEWTRIRLAVRWRLCWLTGSSSDSITGNPDFTFGFCNGTTSIPGTQHVQNFVGIKLDDATVAPIGSGYRMDYYDWVTRTSGSTSYRNYGPLHGSVINYDWMPAATSSLIGGFFDIVRGPDSGSYSASFFRYFATSTPNQFRYYLLSNFLNSITDVNPSETYYAQTTYASKDVFIVDETTYGELDSVCVWWGKSDPVLQIEDLYVVRLS